MNSLQNEDLTTVHGFKFDWNKRNHTADPTQCGLYRPDTRWEGDYAVIIKEVDEFSHAHYPLRCELERVASIATGYPGLPVYFIRGNPDKKGIKSKQYDELALERIRVALDHAKVFSDGFWLRLEFLFYYNIPESERLVAGKYELQTLEFKDQPEYLAWIDRAIPIMEADADRKSYARAAMVPIGKAFEQRARDKRTRQETEIAENGTEYERCKVAGVILERVAKRARAKMTEE